MLSYLRFLVDLIPDPLYPLSLFLRLLSGPSRPFEPLSSQALVDLPLGLIAISQNTVQEALGVAFFEGSHYLLAS